MLASILESLARTNPLVDLALETKNTRVSETRASAISIAGAGFGAGLSLASAVVATIASNGALKGAESIVLLSHLGLGAGFLIACASGIRLRTAQLRINAIKEMVTARAAREAATKIANAGVGMAITGAASAVEFARASAPVLNKLFGGKPEKSG